MGDFRSDPDRPGHWIYDPDAPTPVTASDHDPHATRLDLPVIGGGRVEYAGHVDYARPGVGENDHLVEATYNGLRSDDLAFEQPSQDPGDIPPSLVDGDDSEAEWDEW